jgi:hypothetical protein
MRKLLLALAISASTVGGASAATLNFNEWSGLYPDGLDHSATSYSQIVGGVTMTVTATGNASDKVAYRPNAGLGVLCTSGCIADSPEMGSDLIKGQGREVLTFTFSQAVNIQKIGFYLFDNNIDKARLTYGATNIDISSAPSDNTGKPVVGFSQYVVGGAPLVTSFSVSARGSVTSFRISDITVSAVPVPAAAWLMGSGLLGLAGVARRRRS